jgi:dihydrofolate reductase
MRKLKIMEHISLDGVIQHSADDGDFPYSDWTAPYRTPAGRDAVLAAYGERFDLLLGRRTYDLWSGFWPKAPSSPMADGLNAATKYIATHRPESLDAVRHHLQYVQGRRAFEEATIGATQCASW